jgi:hypothetical protein
MASALAELREGQSQAPEEEEPAARGGADESGVENNGGDNPDTETDNGDGKQPPRQPWRVTTSLHVNAQLVISASGRKHY